MDVFHANSGEAMAVTGTDTKEAAISSLLDEGIRAVLITSGAEGAMLATKECILWALASGTVIR